jgi:hypothetical protein
VAGKVVLRVVKGPPAQQVLTFDERTSCIVGRASDCSPQLPNDEAHKVVSRHHCLLDINPPDIRVRDFGSLNGTFVNGTKIGQRESHQRPEDAAGAAFPEHDLRHGDELGIGNTVFRVEVEHGAGESASPGESTRCAHCGRDVSPEVGQGRQGAVLCAACRARPEDLARDAAQSLNRPRGAAREPSGLTYSIVRELGRGAMGAVYLARCDQTGEQVALKVMLPQVAADERATAMFLREVENTRALSHPNVVRLLDAGCHQGTFFYTLEYCDSGSVDALMERRGGRLSVDEALFLVLQALKGLEYAHEAEMPYVLLQDGSYGKGRGLVHRDLKPENLFLSGSGAGRLTKIGDYGLAKAFDAAGLSGQTRSGAAAGTPVFMPRQQVINFRFAKPEVDVWAMAATLYCMLTGAVPRDFPRGRDPWQVVLQSDPVPIRHRSPNIPHRLAEVIDHALRDRPEIGYKTASEFRRGLEGAV